MNAPNILTAVRFVIIPIFGYYLFIEDYFLAISLFLLGGATDILDGYIARKFNMITSWGKLADPLVDKLMQVTALVILAYLKKIPIFIIVIVIAKECLMGLGSILLYKKENFVVSANWYGKLATVVFYAAIILVIVVDMEPYRDIIIGIAVLPTLYAFVMYAVAYKKIRKVAN